jgi:methionyl-tRNA synthetase
MDGNFYVTTAIPYVNAAPHLGHALELVQADVLARHRRHSGQRVRFLTGTDENALKNVAAAAAAGVPVADFVAGNADRFARLGDVLELSVDDFIRTSSDPRHAPGVRALWERTAARGDVYRRSYEGLYCAGCEQFYEPAELPGGNCPEHGVPPEPVAETNWFFRLSAYGPRILAALEEGRVRVEPPARRNEVLAFVRAGLRDISVSRPAARAAGWGIPVPGDPDQVVYVWWDALSNYVTALGYGGGGGVFDAWWTRSAERVHVVGKGITRFHAVYWLALLLSAGLALPTAVFVHEYLTDGGAKLSKSAGNAVDPERLVARYGVDAVRWWLLSDVARNGDTDFTVERLVDRYHRDLANGVGNLCNRVLSLVHRYRGGIVPVAAAPDGTGVRELPGRIDAALAGFDFRTACGAIGSAVDAANGLIEAVRPWELARAEAAGDPSAGRRLDSVLHLLVAACRVIAAELAPFLPAGAGRLVAQVGAGGGVRVGAPEPVFPRLEEGGGGERARSRILQGFLPDPGDRITS